MNYLSLFSGIGGIDLGLDRAGMTCVGQVEIDDYCRSVLARHWPDAPRHDDVRNAAEWWFSEERPHVDLICAGFPCQPFSVAGLTRGISDERWMWPATAHVIGAVRPTYVLLENVGQLVRPRARDAFGWVLGDLADLGFDAEWGLLSACAFGAPHPRERLFLVAYPAGELRSPWLAQEQRGFGQAEIRPDANGKHAWSRPEVWLEAARAPDRVADGSTYRMVAAGGNAVVPQIPEFLGRLIVEHATERAA